MTKPSLDSLDEDQIKLLADHEEAVAHVRQRDAELKQALADLSRLKAQLIRTNVGQFVALW